MNTTMSLMLTSEEYVKGGGNECPHCRSGNIVAQSHDMNLESGVLEQEVLCYACGNSWTDNYTITLTGYTA